MTAFILAPAARQDLLEIWEHIAQDSLDAADRVRDALHDAMTRLAVNPGIGHLREDLVTEPLRFWRVYSYLIIYRPQAQPLEIVRVLHASRDIAHVLGDP
jgi:toxin ParE1/3/4